jgi:glycosyltransferase involved in cell wall biosynthesis
MMNRIIFDCERMKYENTGLYHYCLNLGNCIKKTLSSVNEEIIFYTPPGVQKLFGNSNHIIQTPLHKFCMPNLKKYKIWHATYQDSYYLPFRNTAIKVVLTVHDMNFMYDNLKSEEKKQRNLKRLQKLINRADVITCISEHTKKDVQFYCDTFNKPVHVIYNGTNSLLTPELCKKSYKPARPFIFSLGTITRKKNVHSLLPLVNNNRTLDLVIAGRPDDADYYNQIIKTAKKMDIQDNVHLVGQISEKEKSWYFNNCKAFAFPSTAEGFGLPVTEAMSAGKPLFLSNKTALPEIGGKVAFYFNNFEPEHMHKVFSEGIFEYQKNGLAKKIISRGKEFNWDNASAEYLKIYRSLY